MYALAQRTQYLLRACLPAGGDDVTIQGVNAIILVDADIALRPLSTDAVSRILLNSRTLTLGDLPVDRSQLDGGLTLAGGTLHGGGAVRVGSELLWTGGTMSGSGTTHVLPTATLQMAGSGENSQAAIDIVMPELAAGIGG